jgi:hypothetical protein
MPFYAAITVKAEQAAGNDPEANHVTDHNTAPGPLPHPSTSAEGEKKGER